MPGLGTGHYTVHTSVHHEYTYCLTYSLTDLREACQTFNICTVLWALDTCKQPTASDTVVPLITTIVKERPSTKVLPIGLLYERPSTKVLPIGLLYKAVGSFVAATSATHFSGFQLRYSTLGRCKIFLFPLKVQNSTGAHPAPI